jgi:4-amino-4-deoxy-L-arabinose transferase-like glycosyltransferase
LRYNGLGRIFGGDGNPGGGGGGGFGGGGNVGFGGATGLFRMFGASFGTEISWLLPAALIALVAGLWFTRRAPRTDRTRMALLLWGGWLAVTALVFSFMNGITHPYYSVALAPPIAALVAIGGRELWRGRAHTPARTTLGAMIAVTGAWSFILLHRTESWLPALRWATLVVSILVATVVIVGFPAARRLTAVLAAAAIITTGAASGAYAVATASATHSGSIPTSGPASAAGGGFGGGTRGGGPGNEQTSSEIASLLAKTDTQWAAATTGAMSGASLELASGKSVIAIGGWDGSDPAPTLAEFQQYVQEGKIAYFVSGGMGMGGGRGNSEIAQWVESNYTATTVGGYTVYDLRG